MNTSKPNTIPWVRSKYRAFDDAEILFSTDIKRTPSIGLKQTGEKKNVFISFNNVTLTCESVTKGIELFPLSEGITKYAHLLSQKLKYRKIPAKIDTLGDTSKELSHQGYFLYIHPDTFPEASDQVISIYSSIGEDGLCALSHNYILIGKNNHIRVVEEELPISFGGSALASSYTEVFIDNDTTASYLYIATPSEDVYSVQTTDWYIGENSKGHMADMLLGGKSVKHTTRAYLHGTGSQFVLDGVDVATDMQVHEVDALINNIALHTSGKVIYHNIVSDKAKLSCDGLIKIEKEADFTDSYLESHTLVLSDDARADAIPGLEIEANEVRASHGATIGTIDEDELFYAMSRGLNKEQAEKIIVTGFLKPALQTLADADIEERMMGYIEKKLHG